MSDTDAFVALAFVLGVGITAVVVLVGFALRLRHRRREMQHREWMAALEKGMPLPDLNSLQTRMGGSRTHLLHGLIWLACGLALTVLLAVSTSSGVPSMEARIDQARQLGYSEEEIKEIAQIWRGELLTRATRQRPPLGLRFLGIVPAGIGVAYLVFYAIEGRRPKQGL